MSRPFLGFILLLNTLVLGGCGGGGTTTASGPSSPTSPATSSYAVVADQRDLYGMAGATISEPAKFEVWSGNVRVAGAQVMFQASGGAEVFPTTAITAPNGVVRTFVRVPNAAFQNYAVTATTSTGASATVQVHSGPRIVSVAGGPITGSSVAPDGRVFGKDAVGPGGTFDFRSGMSAGRMNLFEDTDNNWRGVFRGRDGKLYSESWRLVMVMDDHYTPLRAIDIDNVNRDSADQAVGSGACSAFWNNVIDSSGNSYSFESDGRIGKCSPDAKEIQTMQWSTSSPLPLSMAINSAEHLLVLSRTTTSAELIEIAFPNTVPVRTISLPTLTTNAVVGQDDRIYVTDSTEMTVYESSFAKVRSFAVSALPGAIAGADATGNMYFTVTASPVTGSIKTDFAGNLLWGTGYDEVTASDHPALPSPKDPRISGAAVPAANGNVYFVHSGSVTRYWNGQRVGTYTVPQYFSVVGTDGDHLLLGSIGATQTQINAYDVTMSLVETRTVPTPDISGVTAGADGTWYAYGSTGANATLYAVDRSGSVRTNSTQRFVNGRAMLLMMPEGNILANDSSNIYKLSTSGAVLWSKPFPGVELSVGVDSKNRVFVEQSNFTLDIYDAGGTKLYTFVPASAYGPSLVSGAGRVYEIYNGRMYEISSE